MSGYSYEDGCSYFTKNIKFWNRRSEKTDSCEKAEAIETGQELFSCINSYSLSKEAIEDLAEKGLIKPHEEDP